MAGIAPVAAQGWRHVGAVERVEAFDHGIVASSGPFRVRVGVVAPGVFRVTLAPDGTFDEAASWAVVAGAAAPAVKVSDGREAVTLTSGDVVATVHKAPLRVEFADRAGRVLLADSAQLPMAWSDSTHGPRVRSWKAMPDDEHYYGLGDKAGPLDRRDMAFTNWNTDAYAWQGRPTPSTRRSRSSSACAKGAPTASSSTTPGARWFDFGKSPRDAYSFGSDGGALDYYFINGPASEARVVQRYADLTGKTPLPPLWTLGFQQCRYSYFPEGARLRDRQDLPRQEDPRRRHLPRHRLPEGQPRRSRSTASTLSRTSRR